MLIAVLVLGLVPALVLLTLAILARVRPTQRVVSPGPRFEPVLGATVLDDALLLDADDRAVASVLIDLAVRRQIRLLAGEKTESGRTPIGVEVVDGAAFTTSETTVLEALFGPAETAERIRRFSSDGRRRGRVVRELFARLEKRLVDAGLVRSGRAVAPVVLLRVFGGLGIIATFLIFVVALTADDGRGDGPAVAVSFGALLVAIAGVSTVPHPWRRFTPKARPLREHLAGMREYIALAEAEPLRFVQSTQGAQLRSDVSTDAREQHLQRYLLNERLLPYAVLFGLEKSWAQVLRTDSADLSTLSEVVDVTVAILQVIELAGGAAEIASAVGDLMDVSGKVVGGIGEVFGALS